jgi:hypothetical protein
MKCVMLIMAVLWFLTSCVNSKKIIQKNDIVLLKEYTFCKCIDRWVDANKVRDTTEVSTGSIIVDFDYYGIFTNRIDPIIDSIVTIQFNLPRQKAIEYNPESLIGKNTYYKDCLHLYQSKSVDSVLKHINQKMYKVILN